MTMFKMLKYYFVINNPNIYKKKVVFVQIAKILDPL